MEKIHSLQQLEDCLKAHLIVCTADKKGMLYASCIKMVYAFKMTFRGLFCRCKTFLLYMAIKPFIYMKKRSMKK